MTEVAIIIVVWAILFIIAFVFIPAWRRRHDAESGLYARTQDDNKLSVNYALKQLNCKVRWEKDHEDLVARYDFQSGHFRIRLEKDSPYVRLSYFFFYEASIDNLELVRNVCNQCNLNTETCRLVYSIDEEQGEVDVHIVSALMVTDATVKDVLERAMLNIFKWQNVFARRYNELKNDSDQSAIHDVEKDHASWSRELFLLREQEMMHQDEGPDWHHGAQMPVTLSRMLATAMGLTDIVPAQFSVHSDEFNIVLEEENDILDFGLARPLIAQGAFIQPSATGRLDYYDPRNPVKMRHLTIDFEQEGTTGDTLYYRLTLALTPASPEKDDVPVSGEAPKLMTSVLLGCDLTSSDKRQAEFRYTWKEALAKHSAGKDDTLTDDERLLAQVQDPDLGWLIFRGRMLYEQKRFYEAVGVLEQVFSIEQKNFDKMSDQEHDSFSTLCFFIGSCYMGLHQYRRAIYYLQLLLPTHNIVYTEAFVNCMVNSHDFRALDFLNGLLFQLQHANMDDEDDDEDEPVNAATEAFVNFLKRRKAYVLVSLGRYDEAERMLKKLIDDPESSDFALRELAYIQKKKGK